MPERRASGKLLPRFMQPSANNDWFAARQLAGRAAHAVLACSKRTGPHLLDLFRLAGATTGSLPASWAGRAAHEVLACRKCTGPRVGKGGDVQSRIELMQRYEWVQGVLAVNEDAPTLYRKRKRHLYSETLRPQRDW